MEWAGCPPSDSWQRNRSADVDVAFLRHIAELLLCR